MSTACPALRRMQHMVFGDADTDRRSPGASGLKQASQSTPTSTEDSHDLNLKTLTTTAPIEGPAGRIRRESQSNFTDTIFEQPGSSIVTP